MRHKSKNKTRPLFTLPLEMTRLVNETRLLLVPGVNSDIYSMLTPTNMKITVGSRVLTCRGMHACKSRNRKGNTVRYLGGLGGVLQKFKPRELLVQSEA